MPELVCGFGDVFGLGFAGRRLLRYLQRPLWYLAITCPLSASPVAHRKSGHFGRRLQELFLEPLVPGSLLLGVAVRLRSTRSRLPLEMTPGPSVFSSFSLRAKQQKLKTHEHADKKNRAPTTGPKEPPRRNQQHNGGPAETERTRGHSRMPKEWPNGVAKPDGPDQPKYAAQTWPWLLLIGSRTHGLPPTSAHQPQ